MLLFGTLAADAIIALFSGLLIPTTIVGFILGTISIILCSSKATRYPLTAKLLICTIILTLIFGAAATVSGYVGTVASLGQSTGAAKAEILRLSLQLSNMIFIIAAASSMVQALFLGVSWLILKKRVTSSLSSSPIAVALIALTGIAICGAGYALSLIEAIVTTKPDEALPTTLKLDPALLLTIAFWAGCSAIPVAIIWLINVSMTNECSKKTQNL